MFGIKTKFECFKDDYQTCHREGTAGYCKQWVCFPVAGVHISEGDFVWAYQDCEGIILKEEFVAEGILGEMLAASFYI